MQTKLFLPIVALACGHFASSANASIELISNGGFESGLTGWSQANSGSGLFYAGSGTSTPLSAHATVGPASGLGYAVSDQTGPGVHSLFQSFTVGAGSTVMLSFDMFVNNWAGRPLFNEGGLTTGAGANQHGRVDILTAGAGAFSTAGADVLANLYLDAPNLGNPQAYTPYSFNLSTLLAAGGTYQIRFAEADNQGYLNMGVDNVSILETAVPEPSTYLAGALLLLPFGLQGIRHFRSRKQAA